jgi:hypothetical protein
MANTFIKATKVVRTALGVLERETILPNLVWRDAGGDFAGAYGDTISIRLPAYVTARTRTLRAGTPITVDELTETKVDITLDTDIYKGVNISDENLTLDIVDFNDQVLGPILRAIIAGVEDELVDTITGATYALSENFSKTKPLESVLNARKKLNDCNVPASGRVLAVGSTVERYILEELADRQTGAASSESALNDATVAFNFGGFKVVQSNALPPDEAYAFHKTAFVLSSKAPAVPDGASWGASQSFGGFALRVIKDYDPLYVRDRCIGSVWVGSSAVLDDGDLNDDGQFVPEDGSGSGSPILVRAVKLAIPTGS